MVIFLRITFSFNFPYSFELIEISIEKIKFFLLNKGFNQNIFLVTMQYYNYQINRVVL